MDTEGVDCGSALSTIPSLRVPSVPPARSSTLLLLALVALAQWALVAWGWHATLARGMRARGLARWTVRDTLLVSPLFAGGTLVAIGALDWGLVRAATAWAAGRGTPGDALVAAGVGGLAVVIAAFGIRAVGKLY